MSSSQPLRTMDEVREFILTMPFATAQKLEIEHAADGVGIASMPLSDVAPSTLSKASRFPTGSKRLRVACYQRMR